MGTCSLRKLNPRALAYRTIVLIIELKNNIFCLLELILQNKTSVVEQVDLMPTLLFIAGRRCLNAAIKCSFEALAGLL